MTNENSSICCLADHLIPLAMEYGQVLVELHERQAKRGSFGQRAWEIWRAMPDAPRFPRIKEILEANSPSYQSLIMPLEVRQEDGVHSACEALERLLQPTRPKP